MQETATSYFLLKAVYMNWVIRWEPFAQSNTFESQLICFLHSLFSFFQLTITGTVSRVITTNIIIIIKQLPSCHEISKWPKTTNTSDFSIFSFYASFFSSDASSASLAPTKDYWRLLHRENSMFCQKLKIKKYIKICTFYTVNLLKMVIADFDP